jgi:hypothetical protein
VADLGRSFATDLVDPRTRRLVRISRVLTPVVLAGLVPVVVFTHWWGLLAAAVVLGFAHLTAEAWMSGQRRIMLQHMWELAARSADPISEMAAFQAFRRLSRAERRAVLAWEEAGADPTADVPPGVARFHAALRVLPHEL